MTVYFVDVKYNNVLNNICNLLVIEIYICYIWVVLCRLWYIYFGIIHSISTMKISWQHFIDINAGENNWYLNGATTTWGNKSYIKKLMSCIIIAHIILYATIYLIQTNITVIAGLQFIFRVISIIAPWVAIFRIYRKIPVFHDDIDISGGTSIHFIFSYYQNTIGYQL